MLLVILEGSPLVSSSVIARVLLPLKAVVMTS